MEDEEWGPWVEHDGKKCPVIGQYVQCETDRDVKRVLCDATIISPRVLETIPRTGTGKSWLWSEDKRFAKIVRYRVKKPKGLKMLEQLIQNLPAPTKGKEKV